MGLVTSSEWQASGWERRNEYWLADNEQGGVAVRAVCGITECFTAYICQTGRSHSRKTSRVGMVVVNQPRLFRLHPPNSGGIAVQQ